VDGLALGGPRRRPARRDRVGGLGVDKTKIAISIATLLMVFILQNSQNRDAAALHVKLDEVITHLEGPRDDVAGIETRSHEEIEELHEELHEEVGATEDPS
jgi:low affinity Fe/Cu permease